MKKEKEESLTAKELLAIIGISFCILLIILGVTGGVGYLFLDKNHSGQETEEVFTEARYFETPSGDIYGSYKDLLMRAINNQKMMEDYLGIKPTTTPDVCGETKYIKK